ncbi:c-type cytochrome [Anatilimnocola aggregata]|nr:c-type cytochrome [Anatilimnocola aggregata]
MKQAPFTFVLLLFCMTGALLPAVEPSRELDLPAKQIFSKGPNAYAGEVLEITKGRGAIIGWYVQAKQAEQITVSIEYACERPLDQDYQLSFDGMDRFWKVPVTQKDEWGQVKLGTFRVRAGLPVLVLLVPPSNRKYDHPLRFRKLVLAGETAGNLSLANPPKEPDSPDATPGFGQKLTSLHPALAVHDLRDEALTLRISGMALRGPRELIFTTWDGDLYSFDLTAIPESGPPPFRRIAQGLSEPMGLAVSNGRIFVTEKNEATELLDEDGDGTFETYRCLSHDWPCTTDYHEYLFGAVVKDSQLFFSSSVGMTMRDKDNRQAPLRGSVIQVHVDTGKTDIVAGGLRTPDGIGEGPRGSLLVTDNQGEWLPANKLISVQKGAFYQFRSREPWHPLDRPQATPPAVWLPQGEIANSPTEPILLPANWGPYAGQVVFGDATFGGLQRSFLEEVDGITQGAVFPFSQGFRHLFHRFEFNEAGDLFAGGIARGADKEFIHRVSGLSRIRYTGKEVFEPLAARLRSNGLEVEFTLPLAEGSGWDPAGYYVTRWTYQGTQTYGGAKVLHRRAEVRSATVSDDRRRVFLEIPDLSEGEVLYVRIPESLPSASGLSLWTGEFWFTVNRIPQDHPGVISAAPANMLTTSTPYFRFSEGNAGRVLYRNYCASCHSLDGLKLVGPTFIGLVGSTRKVRDPDSGKMYEVRADAKYLKQSILEPNAQLLEGYPANLMPPVGATLTEKQLGTLISYVTKASDAEFARKEATYARAMNLAWTSSDFPEVGARLTQTKVEPLTLAQGMQAFMKAQCLQCHAVSGVGATVGPDLVESVKKYQGQKLLQQIIEPSSEIHPKYQTQQFLLDNGQVVIGVVLKEDEHAVFVAKNLLTPHELTRIEKSSIEEQGVSKVSAMPNGLLNGLTKTEILEMLKFLEAGPEPIIQPITPTKTK